MSAELAPIDETPAPALSFNQPPLADLAEWADVPERRRIEVKTLLPILAKVHALVTVGEHSLHAASMHVASACRHLMNGLSPVTLRRKYQTFIESGGDWRSLVKGYKGPSKQPKEFTQELKRVAELNHCSVTEALVRVRERWAAGESIAGYGTWLERYQREFPMRPMPKVFPRTYYPAGWSVRNLRRYGPSKGARVLYTRGLAAAKKHFPVIVRDTSNLRRFEILVIDDFELDCLVKFDGDAVHKPQLGRAAGLMMMSVATREKLHWGLGQRLERHEEQADGTMKTVRTGISRVDVQLLLYTFFAKFGLPDYQVTILCENAAAAISPELELSIATLFGGRVRIERTGLIEHRNLTNGFTERGGKPWEKGWIEAAFNGLWNILGSQRGYKGNNQRLTGPGDLDDKIRYTKLLLGQGERKLNLPPDKVAQLLTPFQSLQELERAFAWACGLSDSRTHHKYQGFAQVTEFLLEDGGEPQPFTQLALLSPEQQLKVELIERMESPVERATRLAATERYTAIEPAVLAVFLLTPKRVKYENSAITFTHDRGGKRTGFSFIDRDGDVLKGVQEGTEFLGYFDPANPDRVHITQLNGSLTGTLPRLGGRTGAIDVRDKAALREAAAIRQTIVNRVVAENRALHEHADILEGAKKEHNAAIVAAHKAETAGLSFPEKIALAAGEEAGRAAVEKETTTALKKAKNNSGSFLDHCPPAAAPTKSAGPVKDFSSDDLLLP